MGVWDWIWNVFFRFPAVCLSVVVRGCFERMMMMCTTDGAQSYVQGNWVLGLLSTFWPTLKRRLLSVFDVIDCEVKRTYVAKIPLQEFEFRLAHVARGTSACDPALALTCCW